MFGNNGYGDYYNASLKANKAQEKIDKIDKIDSVIPKTRLFSLVETTVAIVIFIIKVRDRCSRGGMRYDKKSF